MVLELMAVEVALAVDAAAVGVDGMMLAAVGARGGMRSAWAMRSVYFLSDCQPLFCPKNLRSAKSFRLY